MTVRGTIMALFVFIALWPQPGQAHGIKIFAAFEGAAISGSVSLHGGTPLPGAVVTAYAPDGKLATRGATDGEGRFLLPAGDRGPLLLVAETTDGHRAEFTLAMREPGSAWPSPGESSPAAVAPEHELAAMVETVVARQLGPLREQLDHESHRRRLQDVLGGVGYIAGLAGLAMYWAARRKCRKKDE